VKPQIDTPAFKKWFGKSVLVDAKGKPLVLYHGSTHHFDQFRPEIASPENDWGRGIYLSNTVADINANYAGEGPDLRNRIERMKESLMSSDDLSEEEADLRARERLVGTGPLIMPVYARAEKPVILGGKGETVLKYRRPGTFGTFANAIRIIAEKYGIDEIPSLRDMMDDAMDDTLTVRKATDLLLNDNNLVYAEDGDGTFYTREIIRQALEDTGFDGIIDRTVNQKFGSERRVGQPMVGMGPSTFHVIVFKADQVKSAIGNRGTFDRNDPKVINPRQPVQEFPYEYARYLKEKFPRIWAKGGNIRGNDTFRWWTAWRRGDRSPAVVHWHDVTRPAWIARHYKNNRLPGVIAQIKWGTVGVLGVAGMKRVVEDAIRELEL
jgi:hypothetical protein